MKKQPQQGESSQSKLGDFLVQTYLKLGEQCKDEENNPDNSASNTVYNKVTQQDEKEKSKQ